LKRPERFFNQLRATRWAKKFGLGPRNEGQSLVEFAFIIPILLMMVMGILDFARAYNVNQVVTNASREGARVAILSATAAGNVTTTINTYIASANLPGCVSAGGNWGGGGASGGATTVTVTCNFTTLTGTLIPGWSGTFPISQTTTMRHE
jgi:Flp pilus assembly protein TadG